MEKMTSKTHQFKNAIRSYGTELICSTGVSGVQIFKLAKLLSEQRHFFLDPNL